MADGRPTVSANVRALEALLGRLRVLGSELFNLDAFDRWGPKSGPQYEQFMVDDARPQSAHQATEAERAWAAVKSGTQPFVRENTYYVQVDPELHRALFGDGN
jgi:hypothetical protein